MSSGPRIARPIQFSSLPPGEWQVAWFGEVNFHRRHLTYSQPTIEVILLDRTVAGTTTKVCIPIAQLWALTIGSVWVDGVLSGREEGEEERELQFSASKVQPCAAGIPLDEGSAQFLLPFGAHPHHREDTMSSCLRVRIGAEHVVFPAIELIRFYFGSSGALLRSLMSASFEPERLCASHFIDDGGCAGVSLASGVPAASAEDIARMLFSPKARQAAQLVSRSLLTAAAASPTAKVYPRVEFPFDGGAQLQVRGVTLGGDDGAARFLVREIVTCGAHLPWNRLEVSADRSSRHSGAASADQRSSSAPDPGEHSWRRAPSRRVEANEPKSSSAVRFLPLRATMRFTDLMFKPTQRVAGKTPSVVSVQALPAAPFESTGQGLANSKGGRLDQHIAQSDHDDRHRLDTFRCREPLWAAYFEFLTELGRQPWVDAIQFVAVENRNPYVIYGKLPALVDEDGVVLEETMPDPESCERPLISCANIVADGIASAIVSLCPRRPAPRHRVFLWPGRRLDTRHALRAVYECLSAVDDDVALKVPLNISSPPPHGAVRSALEFVSRHLL